MKLVRPVALTLMAVSLLGAADPPSTFELAAVHPSDPNSAWAMDAGRDPTLEARRGELRAGQYQIYSATLVDLISTAWEIDPSHLIGGPPWLDTARFDVIAKVPADTAATSIPGMLQALLADRFHLRMHPDMHPFPEFVLTAGPRHLLKTSEGGEPGCKPTSTAGDRAITCRNISLTQFAQALPQLAGDSLGGNLLLDQTQLSGSFDFSLRWTPHRNFVAGGRGGVSLPEAIEKQLGLSLALRNVLEPVLMGDHADQAPTPNSPAVAVQLPKKPFAFEVATIKVTPPEVTEKKYVSIPGAASRFRV